MARTRARSGRARPPRREQEQEQHPLAELVREAQREEAGAVRTAGDDHTVKKRRIAGRLVVQGSHTDEDAFATAKAGAGRSSSLEPDHSRNNSSEIQVPAQQQVAFDDAFSSSGSDESDWEDVELNTAAANATINITSLEGQQQESQPQDLSLVLDDGQQDSSSRAQPGRRGGTLGAAQRSLRATLHKVHVLCLLAHASQRNSWCNDARIQAMALKVLPRRAVDYLRDNPADSQFQRSRSLLDGLRIAADTFAPRFKVSAHGLSRARWAATTDDISSLEPADDTELPVRREDFLAGTKTMTGSRDLGAQIFCAMLRAAGVETRLVVSLQALPLGTSATATTTDGGTLGSQKQPESRFPVYWVEVFSASHQKWHAVDPVVTHSVSRPAQLEPPGSDTHNQLAYAVAFEADGSARDVTRRYTRGFNAKTRRMRVEGLDSSGNAGEQWWARALSVFERRGRRHRDRDAIEAAQLATKAAQEPMPRALADFRGHPTYALERHLRSNEVVYPRRVIGKIDAGRRGTEDVFRRSDVHLVRSAAAWFRHGREVRPDEQPLKIKQGKTGDRGATRDEEEDTDQYGVPLFAEFQTDAYRAPPVVRGRVPRNAFGNIDVYVPSMIPPGGAHVRHASAAAAARIMGIDAVPAVTGFDFRGRRGNAVVLGVVVADEYADAVVAVVVGIAEDQWRDRATKRSLAILALWKRFLLGLRIRKRIAGYAIEGEDEEKGKDSENSESDEYEDEDENSSEANSNSEDEEEVGANEANDESAFDPPVVEVIRAAFQPEPRPAHGAKQQPEPATAESPRNYGEGGFLPDASEDTHTGTGGFLSTDAESGPHSSVEQGSGGFVPGDDENGFLRTDSVSGGGFLIETDGNSRPSDTGAIAGEDEMSLNDSDVFDKAELAQALVDSAREAAEINRLALAENGHAVAAATAVTEEANKTTEPHSIVDTANTGADMERAGVKADAPEPTQATSADPAIAMHIDREQSDNGSLLSHDPEDEDADPDWLA